MGNSCLPKLIVITFLKKYACFFEEVLYCLRHIKMIQCFNVLNDVLKLFGITDSMFAFAIGEDTRHLYWLSFQSPVAKIIVQV